MASVTSGLDGTTEVITANACWTGRLIMRIQVHDKGWVQLEDCMGGDEAGLRGARICCQSRAETPEDDVRLIRQLMKGEPRHNTVYGDVV